MRKNYHYKINEDIIWENNNIVLKNNKIDDEVLSLVNDIIIKKNLNIVFLILAHDSRSDIKNIENLVMLVNSLELRNKFTVLSFQGKTDENIHKLANTNEITLINNHSHLSEILDINLIRGKSENMLVSLINLNEKFNKNIENTFVVTLVYLRMQDGMVESMVEFG